MKASSLRIKKLWLMIKFVRSRSKVTVKVTCSKFIYHQKGLVIRNTDAKNKALSVRIRKLWPKVKFFKSRSKVT